MKKQNMIVDIEWNIMWILCFNKVFFIKKEWLTADRNRT